MSKPKRIQRKRMKGWRMPPNTVYVGRGTYWGNPYVVESHYYATLGALLWRAVRQPHMGIAPGAWRLTRREAQQDAREMYRLFVAPGLNVGELRGQNLTCWCGLDDPCHADVLIEEANR